MVKLNKEHQRLYNFIDPIRWLAERGEQLKSSSEKRLIRALVCKDREDNVVEKQQ